MVTIRKRLVYVLLTSLVIACWYLIFVAQYAGYDLNLGLFFLCLFLSTIGSFLCLNILKSYQKRHEILLKIFCAFYLIISSPITIILFIKIYAIVNGNFFR